MAVVIVSLTNIFYPPSICPRSDPACLQVDHDVSRMHPPHHSIHIMSCRPLQHIQLQHDSVTPALCNRRTLTIARRMTSQDVFIGEHLLTCFGYETTKEGTVRVLSLRQQQDVQGGAGNITLGILLTLASQIFQAVRLIMEESLLTKMDLHPMEVSQS